MEFRNKPFTSITVAQRLIELIETHAHELTLNLIQVLQKHDNTPTYHTYDVKELYNRAFDVYSQLGKWVSQETKNEDIAAHYMALGTQRRKEGFALSEVIHALFLTRRCLWQKILEEGFLDTVLDFTQAIELNNRVLLFFDRAIYYTALGYEQKI